MKRNPMMTVLVTGLFILACGFIGVPSGHAVQEHHEASAQKGATGPSGSGDVAMPQVGESGGGHGMMEMMGESGDAGGDGMMSTMGPGMMPMMMSHMMGGPGGMGKMMGNMKFGMGMGMGNGMGPAGMAKMLETLDLTPGQWDQVRTLARKHLEKMADMWARQMKLRIEMAALRPEQEIDREAVKKIFVNTAEARAEMFLTGLEYMRELKGVLNQGQLKKWEAQGF